MGVVGAGGEAEDTHCGLFDHPSGGVFMHIGTCMHPCLYLHVRMLHSW